MDTLIIDIINPKAKKLLEDLEALNLISIKRNKKGHFIDLVNEIRGKFDSSISLEEITKEVEAVRNH